MWGSTFADLAKKAQELQEQASQQASSLSATSPGGLGLFNLDAMQSKDDDDDDDAKNSTADHVPLQITQQHPPLSVDRLLGNTATKTPIRTPTTPLRVPTTPNTITAPHMSREDSVDETSAELVEDGWGEEDDDVSVEDLKDDSSNKPTLPAQLDQTNSMLSSSPPEEISNQKQPPPDESQPEPPSEMEAGWDHDLEVPSSEESEEPESAQNELETEKVAEAVEPSSTEPDAVALEEDQPQPDAVVIEDNEAQPVATATEEPEPAIITEDNEPEPALVTTEDQQKETPTVPEPTIEATEKEATHTVLSEPISESPKEEETTSAPMPKVQPEPEPPVPSDPVSETKAVEEPEVVEEETLSPSNTESTPPSMPPKIDMVVAGPSNDQLLEQFSHQMERLQENFEAEKRAMEQQHALELEAAMASLNHDDCIAERDMLIQQHSAQLSEKKAEMTELMRTLEGYELKMDTLKRELEGTQKILQAKETDIGKNNAVHNRDVQMLDKQVKQANEALRQSQEENKKLQERLDTTVRELETSEEAYETLKERVKVVAGELKERRVECRALTDEAGELRELNDRLHTQVANLQSQLSDHDQSRSAKDVEMDNLRTKLATVEKSLSESMAALKKSEEQGEAALAAYKKKAQTSLAIANSRTAAAVQAKEEAELEARAARATADASMDRVIAAETKSREAITEAKSYVKEMEEKIALSDEEVKKALAESTRAREELEESGKALSESRLVEEKLRGEIEQLNQTLKSEQETVEKLQDKLLGAQMRSAELLDEVGVLREEIQRASAEKSSSDGTEDTKGNGSTHGDRSVRKAPLITAGGAGGSKAEATIVMLQQELQIERETVRDLKETLKNHLEGMQNGDRSAHADPAAMSGKAEHDAEEHILSSAATGNKGSESTPLFYAIEKQAELNTARDEINRLANLLGDAESAKMDALDSMEEMRRAMEEAQAKLKRYEKLGSAAGLKAKPNQTLGRPVEPSSMQREANEGAHSQIPGDSGSVNLEFLKNVMLSYLNAKSQSERKALVPVVSAVLCLTEEEQARALANQEESSGIEQTSTAFFETIGKLF